ncbi:hypothetical protein LG401_02330 [Bacillus pumilus]|uniref:hypothetical protein n=1 Tax=Bacillus TaxID=1386 RepID=UPI001CB95D86|nr:MULTISPECIES: hypothetical protein [Bacillus]MCW6699947.1 hypothetical protein [Bacillus sp. RP12]UCZ71402.1 hypothetical protein LG401_02330 [Bacillus pumilus]
MSDHKISIMSEKFENENTGEHVEGITIMIDGKLKSMLDIIIEKRCLQSIPGINKEFDVCRHSAIH